MTALAAMKQALETLEEATTYTASTSWSPSMTEDCNKAITSLRAAIAEMERAEPFAQLCVWRHGNIDMITDSPPDGPPYELVDVYTHPAPSQGIQNCSVTDNMKHDATAQIADLKKEILRLQMEVSNRNRRALDGDEAVNALNGVHQYYENRIVNLATELDKYRNAIGIVSDVCESAMRGIEE